MCLISAAVKRSMRKFVGALFRYTCSKVRIGAIRINISLPMSRQKIGTNQGEQLIEQKLDKNGDPSPPGGDTVPGIISWIVLVNLRKSLYGVKWSSFITGTSAAT